MPTVRPAAVAGAFYPADPRALAADIEEMLGGVESYEPRLGFPKALVVPHAGYIYSGPVAARAYDDLAAARGIVKRVVLLGPVHRVPVRGLALPDADFFDTPLGRIPIDQEAVKSLAGLRQVVRSGPAHAMEHSLEVQLPFLQRMLGGFSLVPFAVGNASAAEVAEVIERLWGGPETLVVISTDLSHYHPYNVAREVDRATIARIAARATDLNHNEACGATPLNGLLFLGKQKNLTVKLLAANNSGDTAGGRDRVGSSRPAIPDCVRPRRP
jgi:AmmeMemoRadiSam system protein B